MLLTIISIYISSCTSVVISEPTIVNMRIVDEVSNYGWNAFAGPDSHTSKLKAKFDPSPISGPAHFAGLANKCFTYVEKEYKYEFCPYHNVTQHEQTMRWNPYSGILGVWSEWKIENNIFKSMLMKNGDSCGNADRQVEVFFSCSLSHNLTSVAEPSKCHYNFTFETPLVCHKDSMLVYPVINATLQKEWDILEQDYHDKLLTYKGYSQLLNGLFHRAGLVSAAVTTQVSEELPPKNFSSLETCNAEYVKLTAEIEKLKTQLKGQQNNT